MTHTTIMHNVIVLNTDIFYTISATEVEVWLTTKGTCLQEIRCSSFNGLLRIELDLSFKIKIQT